MIELALPLIVIVVLALAARRQARRIKAQCDKLMEANETVGDAAQELAKKTLRHAHDDGTRFG